MKPTKAQKKWIECIRESGGMLLTKSGEEDCYTLTNGRVVRSDLAQALINRGLVVPQNDGLFDSFTQIWVAP